MVETLIERLHEAWDIHSYLFNVKTSSKEEGMIAVSAAVWTEDLYTAICRATSKSGKTAFIVWISWKKLT